MILAQGVFFGSFWEIIPLLLSVPMTPIAIVLAVVLVGVRKYRGAQIVAVVAIAVGAFNLIVLLFWDVTAAAMLIEISPLWTGFVLLIYASIASARGFDASTTVSLTAPTEPPAANVLEYSRVEFDQRKSNPPRAIRNWAALTSAALGFLGCLPYVGGLAAVIFGIIGLRKGRDPAVGDRFLAWTGLLLGSASFIAWSLPPLFVAYENSQIPAAEAVARQFAADMSQRNIAAALALSTGLSSNQLQSGVAPFAKFVPTASNTNCDSEMLLDPFLRIDVHGYVYDGSRSLTFEVFLDKEAGHIQSRGFQCVSISLSVP